MENSKFFLGVGVVIVLIGAVIALIVGFKLEMLGAVEHPLRWWYAGGTFLFTTIAGLIIMGIGALIGEVEYQGGRKPESERVEPVRPINGDDYNPQLDHRG